MTNEIPIKIAGLTGEELRCKISDVVEHADTQSTFIVLVGPNGLNKNDVNIIMGLFIHKNIYPHICLEEYYNLGTYIENEKRAKEWMSLSVEEKAQRTRDAIKKHFNV